MSLFAEQNAFLRDITNLWDFAWSKGFIISGRELGRTIEQQQIYVRTGRSQTMNSNHLRNTAMDMYFMKEGKLVQDKETLQEIGDYWEGLNPKNSWGGNWNSFKDVPHFERRTG